MDAYEEKALRVRDLTRQLNDALMDLQWDVRAEVQILSRDTIGSPKRPYLQVFMEQVRSL